MLSVKTLSELPKEVMWRVLGFVDESHRAHCAAVARRWSNFGGNNRTTNGVRSRARGSIPNELLVGLVLQFLDEPDEGDRLRHIVKVWASYLAQTRVVAAAVAAAATAAAAAAAATAAGDGHSHSHGGIVPFLPLGTSFGPATEPGPLDTTGRLPNELLESMFDFLDEDMTMNCASVARRWRASAMELILTSFLSPILWVIPQGAVHNICSNLHPTDISQVACVCQDWKQLAQDVPTLAPGLVD